VPNLIFVACSSFGTVAGLLLGLCLLGFQDTKVYGVEVEKEPANKRKPIIELALETYKYMLGFDSSLPEITE